MNSTPSDERTRNGTPSRLGYLILALCVVTTVFVVFVKYSGINQSHEAKLSDLVYGTARRPFVGRVLVPATIRTITAAVPPGAREQLNTAVGDETVVQKALSSFNPQQGFVVESAIGLILTYLALLGFVFAFRYLLMGVYHAPTAFVDLVPLIATLGLVPFFKQGYIYDFSTLFLFTLGLGLLARAKWGPYLVAFALACLNKETAILLTLVFAIHFYSRIGKTRFIKLLLVQGVIYGASRVFLSWTFRENQGSTLTFNLHQHLDSYNQLPFITLLFTLLWIFIAFLTFYRWKEKPIFLRHALVIIIPLFVSHMLWGMPYELRVFYEVYPVVILLCAYTIWRALGQEIEKIDDVTGIDDQHLSHVV